MLTKTQYELLSLDMMKKGLYDTSIKVSPILQRIPQIDVVGKAVLYNIVSTEAGANWYQTGDVWAESVAVPIQRTTSLKILGGDADVDNFMNQTRSNVNDQMASAIEKKTKAIMDEFEKQFIVGGTTSTPDGKSFDGVLEQIAQNETTANQTTADLDPPNNSHVAASNSTSGALTLADLDELIDLIIPGKPDFLLTSRRSRRKINALARASGSSLQETHSDFGDNITIYNSIPLLISDHVPDNVQDGTTSSQITDMDSFGFATTRASGYDNSLVLAIKAGADDFYIIQNGGMETEPIGTVQNKDAKRTRIKWYVGLCNPNIFSLAVLINYNPDS